MTVAVTPATSQRNSFEVSLHMMCWGSNEKYWRDITAKVDGVTRIVDTEEVSYRGKAMTRKNARTIADYLRANSHHIHLFITKRVMFEDSSRKAKEAGLSELFGDALTEEMVIHWAATLRPWVKGITLIRASQDEHFTIMPER
jgi:hypothetical protein